MVSPRTRTMKWAPILIPKHVLSILSKLYIHTDVSSLNVTYLSDFLKIVSNKTNNSCNTTFFNNGIISLCLGMVV